MATMRKEAATKSFFSSPSSTLKRLVNVFPKSQKTPLSQLSLSKFPSEQQQFHTTFAVDCEDGETCMENQAPEFDFIDRSDSECGRIPFSSATENAGRDAVTAVEVQTDFSNSSEDEYPRPRIRPDLLPHDFSAWQKSSSLTSSTSRDTEAFSEVLSSSTSQERYASQRGVVSDIRKPRLRRQGEHLYEFNSMENGRNTTQSKMPRNAASLPTVGLHVQTGLAKLPDLRLDFVANGSTGSCKYGIPAAMKAISDDCRTMHSVASENGWRNSFDGSCEQRRNVLDPLVTSSRVRDLMQEGATLHQNFSDMAPFIESLRDDWDDGYHRNNFQHHASMVYTRAPTREALMKKQVSDVTNASRFSRQQKKLKKKSDATWEDQENLPRQPRGPDLSCSPHIGSYENAVDIAKLQGQVEELQRKLSITEGVLQSYSVSAPKNKCSEIIFLERKMGDLERKLSERGQLLESAQDTIILKENEIQVLQRLIREAEEIHAAQRARSEDNEEQLMNLRCEVAALRWQSEVEAERTRTEIKMLEGNREMQVEKEKRQWENGKTEPMRKMYLAALVVARICPREECLALVHILRTELQILVNILTMRLP